MPRFTLVFLSVLTLTAFAAHPSRVSATVQQDRLIVRPRRILLVRSAKLARRFPDRKTATVTYPVVSGLSNPAVLRRVRSLLAIKNVFDSSLQDYRQETWLDEFSYEVNYNRNSLFDITFTQNGTAAYPDGQSKHFLINLKDGRVVKAADVFLGNKFRVLSALVDQKLQVELKEMITQAKTTSDLEATESQSIVEALEQMKFATENLDDFSVNAKGITFLYDAGLPHAIQAFEPEGRYFFSYSELTPYLKRRGPLGQFVH